MSGPDPRLTVSGAAITVRGLTKRYGTVTAVDALDLTVRRGTVHGFLGPNGAGKSTTMRAILGMIRPDAGSIDVLGRNPVREPAAATGRVAYAPAEASLWPGLTGGRTLATMAALRAGGTGPSTGDDPDRRAALIDRFGLDPSKRIREYSTGNRHKVMLIAALAADADLLVLDEPTSGLDPIMVREFASCVRERVDEGASVLLSSHDLAEVQDLADDVTIIREGRLVETGSLGELRHLRGSAIRATLPGGRRVDLLVPRDEVPAALSDLLAGGATGITCAEAGLDDVFLAHYPDGASSAHVTRRRAPENGDGR